MSGRVDLASWRLNLWPPAAGLAVAAALLLPGVEPAAAVTAQQIFETIIPRSAAPKERRRHRPAAKTAPAGEPVAPSSRPAPPSKPPAAAMPPHPAPRPGGETVAPPLPESVPEEGPVPERKPEAEQAPMPPEKPLPPAPAATPPADAGPAEPPVVAPPIPRPEPAPAPAGPPPAAATAPPRPLPDTAALAACRAGMDGLGIVFKAAPPIVEGDCGAPDPFIVTGLAGGVTIVPAATVDCAVATALARWLAEDVQPAARAAYGSEVTRIAIAGSYSCRGRDDVPGAKLSEHAFANAIDIAAVAVAGRSIAVAGADGRSAIDSGFIATLRRSACTRFTTVLGPGSDAWHDDHLHLDMIRRGRSAHFCQ